MSLTPGRRLGPYEIIGPLGAGGMGEVYKAKDTRLDRIVAIKVLPQHLSANPEVRARFEREARAVSSLNHPHICVLHDIGNQDGMDYLVLEHLEGETLAARLEKGPLPPDQVLKTGSEIADALEKAHKSGLVHRDLKPGNVMMTKSGAKLMDFGLARATGMSGGLGDSTQSPTMSQPLTAEGTILGTFQYMAPEQLEGNEADARTDLFAFGATIYEMATGRKAFAGKSQASLVSAIMASQPEPISSIQPMAPAALDRVVRQCLAKDPDERYASTKDLARDLKSVRDHLSEAGVSAAPPHTPRSRAVVATASGLILIALAAAALALRHPAAALPAYRQLTFRRGTLNAARYSPDGHSVIYSAAWEGRPREIFEKREASPESRPLGLVGQGVLSISRSGPLAVLMNARPVNQIGRASCRERV